MWPDTAIFQINQYTKVFHIPAVEQYTARIAKSSTAGSAIF